MFRTSLVHHQEFVTVHEAIYTGLLILLASCQQTCIYCLVYSDKLLMMDKTCLKRVEFYSKNKFEKSVYLVVFIIRICHDARSPEYQIPLLHVSA